MNSISEEKATQLNSKGKPGAAFERLAAAVHAKLGPTAEVRWDERIGGAQIDVAIRGEVAGTSVLVVVECKDYDKPLGIGFVRSLLSVKNEAKANKGILVTRTEFTAGALRLAETNGIETAVLRPSRRDDRPEGRVRIEAVNVAMILMGHSVADVEVTLVDGRRLSVSPRAALEDQNGDTIFIDQLVKGAMLSEEGQGKTGRIGMTLTPPPKLLLDSECPRVATLECTVASTELTVSDGPIWTAPEEWVFVKHGRSGLVDEPKFFEFPDLKRVADGFRSREGGP